MVGWLARMSMTRAGMTDEFHSSFIPRVASFAGVGFG